MGKLWIYLLLLSACVAAITAQKDDNSYPEEWDYLDNIYDDILPDISEEKQAEAEKSAEINDDYQIEDNRSAPKDETEENNVAREETSIEHNNGDIEVKKGSDLSAENKDEKLVLLDEVDENNPGLADKTNDDENKSNPKSQEVPANDKTLKEQVDDLIDNAFSRLKDIDDKIDVENPVATEILEETKQILKETNDKFDADEDTNNYDDEPTDTDNIENIEEDTVDKVYDDLNADLEKLMETWKKLNEDNVEPETNADDSIIPSLIPENEVKFSLSKEKVDELNDKNDAPAQKQNITGNPLSNDKTLNSEELDDIIDEAAEGNEYYEEEEEKEEDDENGNDDEDDNDDNDEAIDEEFSNNDDTIDKVADEIKPQADDGDILTQGQPSTSTVESTTAMYPMVHQTSEQTSSVLPMTDTTEKGINVTDLTPEQYDNLMTQFKLAYLEKFELTDDELGRNVAPIHMELSLDEARVFTSPNYPSPYPTNNIIDWIFTGDGMGIELNITDFFVNGALGDYLLIKPGGVDASGTDGIVFSYQLVEPRRYRFLSVDQMFVRFEARPGMAFTRGFSFSAKMILPRVDLFDDYELPAEPKILEPTQTLTLFLGGNTLPEFRSSQEAFRHIIADMATMYINYNGIDIGRNSTLEVTQITRTAPCDVHWPDYEYCSKVTFGVPLVYDEEDDQEPRLSAEDLQAMWSLYSIQDPFALRLNRIGVTEFTIPDVNAKITLWTALTAAVVVFMVLVALALWRYSCFENYTRMPTYSNRDSIYNEKQGLDLYPTPHQTLPPLYSENEYKWDDGKFDETARVDLGGFTNKSYARDMYDLESDEEVGIAPRDRNAGIAPNYKYEV